VAHSLRKIKVATIFIAETVVMIFAGFVKASGKIMDLGLVDTMLATSMRKRRAIKNSKIN